jgi:hypothetical protein
MHLFINVFMKCTETVVETHRNLVDSTRLQNTRVLHYLRPLNVSFRIALKIAL